MPERKPDSNDGWNAFTVFTMLVTTSMSQLTAVCLQAHQWAQTCTAQSNSHSRRPQLADEP